ncbi:ubiquitin-conjugating enzyme E2 2 [Platysternon megacephalum]|uniref:Ubiquitin-conjugating enzyme E2 2 n=1 Tax=Platysternon megacephalum TaxID=55544 RepID=A0A4D9DDJ4_9SAUR|nr:ubiquitin-conjugating enzyme E2 2 [Platysternon megacephalum]
MPIGGSPYLLENNVFVLGDNVECVVIDAPHDVEPIMDLVGSRQVKAIIVTHAHPDHVNAAEELRRRTGAPLYLHPADAALWSQTCEGLWDEDLADGQQLMVAGAELRILHTPGHTPGSCMVYVPEQRELFSGDTLFPGGPGKTNSEGDFAQIMSSLDDIFGALDDDVIVHPGHGADTTLGAERGQLPQWRERGW